MDYIEMIVLGFLQHSVINRATGLSGYPQIYACYCYRRVPDPDPDLKASSPSPSPKGGEFCP